MPPTPAASRRPSPLRADVRLASWNAALWAIGSGLAPTVLITYLAMDLGAKGLQLSGVLAAPRLAGVLRLYVPALISGFGSRKTVCLAAYAASGVALVLLPLLSAPGGLGRRAWGCRC